MTLEEMIKALKHLTAEELRDLESIAMDVRLEKQQEQRNNLRKLLEE
jgi:hypothetical protein